MSKIGETGKRTRDAPLTAACQLFGTGLRRALTVPPNAGSNPAGVSRIIPLVLFAALAILAVSVVIIIIYEAPPASAYHSPGNCVAPPAGYQIVLGGNLDVADGTLCSNRDDYYLGIYLRDANGNPATHTSNICVLLERISGSEIIAEEIGLPRENYIRAGDTNVVFRMNADTDLQARTLDGEPVVIGARSGTHLSTFPLTVVHGSGAESCPAPSTPRTTPTSTTPTTTPTGTTPTTAGTTPTTTGTTPTGGTSFFAPFSGGTTPPTILSMNITGNATRTLGEGGPLLFNITFSKPVTGVDPTDFVLVSGNDTIPVSANATLPAPTNATIPVPANATLPAPTNATIPVPANATILNATIYPEQVIPYGDTTEFVIEIEPNATYGGATISGGTVRFDIEHLGSHLLEVRLTAPDCRTILVHNQTFLFRPDLAKPRTIEPLAGSPVAGPWALSIRDHALYQNATVHLFGLSLDVGPAIVINGTGSNYLVAVNAAVNGNLTLGLADGHDITDISGNRLAGGIPAGTNNTYVLTEPPRRTCP